MGRNACDQKIYPRPTDHSNCLQCRVAPTQSRDILLWSFFIFKSLKYIMHTTLDFFRSGLCWAVDVCEVSAMQQEREPESPPRKVRFLSVLFSVFYNP